MNFFIMKQMSSRFAFQVQNAIKAIVKHNNVQVKDNNAQHGKLLYAALQNARYSLEVPLYLQHTILK